MADKTATFNLAVKSDGSGATKAADELEGLKKAIDSSKSVIESYAKSMRALRGNSEEVASAKKDLKAKIDAERDAISRNTLALLKAGTSYEQLSKKTKKASQDTKDFKDVVGTVGGPVADMTAKFGSWKDLLAACSDPLVLLGILVTAAVASFAVFAAGVVTATLSLAKFVAESANVLRAQGLMREGVLGTTENAKAFGHQIDDLANKLATPKEKLNDLAVSLSKTFVNSRVSGQAIVDTFQAVARASDAMGDQAGAALASIIERSKLSGRVGINPLELRQIGIDYNDLAKSIAKSTGTGVEDARRALLNGTAPVGAAAQALREAAEKRFGAINAKKLLDLNVISAKFQENLQGLTKDVDLSPFLEVLKTLADLFSDTTSTGHTLKEFVTSFGNTLGVVAKAALPYLVEGIKTAINWGLKFGNTLLDLTIALVRWGQSASGQTAIKTTLAIVSYLAETALATFQSFVNEIGRVGPAIDAIQSVFTGLLTDLVTLPAKAAGIGADIIAGITKGLLAKWDELTATVGKIAGSVKDVFKNALGIQSPSRVFAEFGRQTTAGYEQGVTAGAGDAQDAVLTMVTGAGSAPSAEGGPAGGGSSSRPAISVTFQIGGSADARKAAEIIKDGSVLEALTRAIEIASRGIGIPTQSPVGA